jgi:hypothetical protein
MKTLKINLTATEYTTIKALFNAASKDIMRAVLTKVYYDAQYKHCVTTDGYILRVEDMDLGNESFLISDIYFMDSTAQLKAKYHNWLKSNCPVEFTIEYDETEYYPDVLKVIPSLDRFKANNNAPIFGIDFDTVTRFNKSFRTDIQRNFIMVPTTYLGAILVYRYGAQDDYNPVFTGVIMPLKGNNAIEKIRQWSPTRDLLIEALNEIEI